MSSSKSNYSDAEMIASAGNLGRMDRRALRILTGLGAAACIAIVGLLASCGGGGSGSSMSGTPSNLSSCVALGGTNSSTSNVSTVLVDSGPNACSCTSAEAKSGCAVGSVIGAANIGYVTVEVCQHGTTTCQSIDHVMVDTGSSGLRLMASAFNAVAASSFTRVQTNGTALYECAQFADGFAWGSVRIADVKIGGESAASQNIQVIGESSAGTPPSGCAGTGTELDDNFAFGANGVLGVGLFINDCVTGSVCPTGNNFYFNCSGISTNASTPDTCAESTVAANQQVANPVASFAADNTGVIVELPAIASTGGLNVTGSLVFGINTQSNNLTSTQTVYQANPGDLPESPYLAGDFNSELATMNAYTGIGTNYSNSFFDSGSNGIFLPGTTIPCDNTYGWFTPTSAVSITASLQGEMDTNAATGTIGSLNFSIGNSTSLFATSNTAFNNLGGPVVACANSVGSGTQSGDNGGIDWGLPIFFGNNIFVGIEGKSIIFTSGTYTGPLWAL